MQNVVFESQFERITTTVLPPSLERRVTITPLPQENTYEIAVLRQQQVCFENRMNAPMEETFMQKHLGRLQDECREEFVDFTDGRISISYIAAKKHCSLIVTAASLEPDLANGLAKTLSDSFDTSAERDFEYRMNAPLVAEAIAAFRTTTTMTYNQPVLESDMDEISRTVFDDDEEGDEIVTVIDAIVEAFPDVKARVGSPPLRRSKRIRSFA